MAATPDSSPSAELRLPVAAVARRLGVAPATLRTWDRRYGVGPTGHAAGQHRRYSAADLSRLETMRRLIAEGVPPAEAARASADARVASPVTSVVVPAEAVVSDSVPGGGRVLAMPSGGPAQRGLARAAMALDSEAVDEILAACIAGAGVIAVWEQMLVPVLTAVGDRWAATGEGVEVEHLLSECALRALRPITLRAPRAAVASHPLLTCAPDENHSLPVHVLAAALAERGLSARVLGAATPTEALDAAVRRVGASAVFIWSQLPATADRSVLAGLPRLRPAPSVVAGGPGWASTRMPPRVTYADSLEAAVELISIAHRGAAES